MFDSILAILGEMPPWAWALLVPVGLVWRWNENALKAGPEDKAFQRRIDWLRENNYGELYIGLLGWLMDRVGRLIGDQHKFGQSYARSPQSPSLIHKTFGFNPFTPESYERLLRLALMYPVFSFLFAWAMGGIGQIAESDLLGLSMAQMLTLEQRWLLVCGFIAAISVISWFMFHWQGWYRWILLNALLVVVALVQIFIGERDWPNLLLGWIIFVYLFVFTYIGGWLSGVMIYFSIRKAHQVIYSAASAFSGIFAIAISIGSISAFVFIFIADLDSDLGFGLHLPVPVFSSNPSYNPSSGPDFGPGFVSNTNSAFAYASVVTFPIAIAAASAFSGAFYSVFSSAFTFAVAGVLASVYSFNTIIGFTGNITGAFTFTGAFALATGSASAFAFAGFIIAVLKISEQWATDKEFVGWFWVFYTMLFLGLGCISLVYLEDSNFLMLLLFLLLLPLVNAPLDWLSLGVTRGLLQSVRSGYHKGLGAISFALVDLLLALVFLFLIAAVLVGVTFLSNAVSGNTLLDIQEVLAGMSGSKAGDINNWWIYFMLLSTLVPTLIHFALAGGAVTLWAPRKLRLKLADGLEKDSDKKLAATAYLTFMPFIGFVIVPGLLLYGLWWVLDSNGAAVGQVLLHWAGLLAGCGGTCVATQ